MSWAENISNSCRPCSHRVKIRKQGIYLIVQHLILHLQPSHERVLREAVRPAAILLVGPRDLLIQRLDIRGQEAVQLEFLALIVGERRSFVEVGVVQKFGALRDRFSKDQFNSTIAYMGTLCQCLSHLIRAFNGPLRRAREMGEFRHCYECPRISDCSKRTLIYRMVCQILYCPTNLSMICILMT